MFLESLVETPRSARTRRSWATFASFCIETGLIGLLVLLPLLYTQAIPALHFSEQLTPPPAAPKAPKLGRSMQIVPVPVELRENAFVAPRWIPTSVYVPDKPEVVPTTTTTACVGCVEGGVDYGANGTDGGNTLMAQLLHTDPVQPVIKGPAEATRKLVISHMQESMLISRVEPKYPPLAIASRTEGPVVLAAVIGRDGRIENLRLVSGHPLLAKAALDAVQQWRYRPTVLNGQPVEVETQITVKFTLTR